MTNILIIEDDAPAVAQLRRGLQAVGDEFEGHVLDALATVEDAVRWFRNGGQPDLLLCNIQLRDGHSFHIFRQVLVRAPVIFLTGFENYVLQALEYNGIDYLLKPVHEEELRKALRKVAALHYPVNGDRMPAQQLNAPRGGRRRSRIVVQKGLEQVALPLSEVALFYTEQKVVFVLDRKGSKYLCDKPLQALEEELDPQLFFRANRQYLIHIDYIQSFRTFEKSKLRVEMDLPGNRPDIVISQEMAPRFRRWIEA